MLERNSKRYVKVQPCNAYYPVGTKKKKKQKTPTLGETYSLKAKLY